LNESRCANTQFELPCDRLSWTTGAAVYRAAATEEVTAEDDRAAHIVMVAFGHHEVGCHRLTAAGKVHATREDLLALANGHGRQHF
jgi:hypothetical protein